MDGSEQANTFFKISQLYARQTQAIDEGDIAQYSNTFALQAVIVNTANNSRLIGRDTIHSVAMDNFVARKAIRLQSRHFMFTPLIRYLDNGLIGASSRVLIMQILRHGFASILASVICDDIIVCGAGHEPTIQFRTISLSG
ncbi:nuclear transport factor 2 family protein [Propionibacterium ruminifibrarum]|uniref:nuclear transport factor 2 family protein n=1 Tax=Propionibacterium ruminifibrarum TaxID=1962131 RepID=UPI0016014AC1|nr:nuclear transport factor 2 family protein [Propionibacterium ruminifibrarum]